MLQTRAWFDDKDALAVVSLVERARRDFYNSKTKQTKLTSFFGRSRTTTNASGAS